MNRFSKICILFGIVFLLVECGGGSQKRPVLVDNPIVDSVPSPVSITPILKVFVENSISMDGYVYGNENDETPFKKSLYGFLVNVKPQMDSVEVYYINNRTKYIGDEEEVKKLNPNTFQQFKGDVVKTVENGKTKSHNGRQLTNLVTVIDSVVSYYSDSTITMLVSDFVSDQGYIESTLQNHLQNFVTSNDDFTVSIWRQDAEFDGDYYDPNDGKSRLNKEKRPYYIWVFASEKHLKTIVSQMEKVSTCFCCFARGEKELNYKIVYNSGKFELNKKGNLDHSIVNAKKDSKTQNKLTLSFDVDFANTVVDDSYLSNVDNYLLSDTLFSIESITYSPNDGFTHRFKLSSPRPISETLVITLKQPSVPRWVDSLSDGDGYHVKDNLDKTYKLNELVGGVAASFDSDYYTKFEISINQ